MADLELNVTILDIDVQKAAAAFLRKCKMPQIEDPEDPGKSIDEFPSTKAWVQEWLAADLLRAINAGIGLLAEDLGEKLTRDIFKRGEI